MTIEQWWPRLQPESRDWLTANNGDVVPEAIIAEVEAAGGPGAADPWWSQQEGSAGLCMPDEAVDWIDERANEENTTD